MSPQSKKRKRKPQPIALTALLGLWFGRPLKDLPDDLRKVVTKQYHPFPWDTINEGQRRQIALQLDAQNLALLDKVDRYLAESAFRHGYKIHSVPERNKRNAKRPRPSRQIVFDDVIVRMKCLLQSEGVRHHKQCSEAYRRLMMVAGRPIAKRSFLERWNRLGLNKMGG